MIIRTKLTTQNQFLRRFSMNRLLNRYPVGRDQALIWNIRDTQAKASNLVYLMSEMGRSVTILFGRQEGDSQGSVSSLLKN